MHLSPQIVTWLTSLRRGTQHGEPRPHKPVLLLAVLELAEAGHLGVNEICFGPALFEPFAAYWTAVTDEPVGKIQYPFWFMDSEPFWGLVMQPGFEAKPLSKRVAPSAKQVSEWVRFARLDDALFAAVSDPETRGRIRGVLVATYFPERAERIAEIRSFEQSVTRYSRLIRRVREPGATYQTVPEFVRAAAFRRVVTEAYGYTCAVSGLRLTLPAGATYQLVEAAHIHDWADSHTDDPRNGLSLSRDYHWLFDRGLFTLDERCRVRVSPVARDCIGSVGTLLARYRGAGIRLPADERLRPGQEYLDWHRTVKFLAG